MLFLYIIFNFLDELIKIIIIISILYYYQVQLFIWGNAVRFSPNSFFIALSFNTPDNTLSGKLINYCIIIYLLIYFLDVSLQLTTATSSITLSGNNQNSYSKSFYLTRFSNDVLLLCIKLIVIQQITYY